MALVHLARILRLHLVLRLSLSLTLDLNLALVLTLHHTLLHLTLVHLHLVLAAGLYVTLTHHILLLVALLLRRLLVLTRRDHHLLALLHLCLLGQPALSELLPTLHIRIDGFFQILLSAVFLRDKRVLYLLDFQLQLVQVVLNQRRQHLLTVPDFSFYFVSACSGFQQLHL